MCPQNLTGGLRRQIGIQRVRLASGRQKERRRPNDRTPSESSVQDSAIKPPKPLSSLCRHAVPIVLFTVCALYAGTLVAQRTTGSSHAAVRSHQLSAAAYIFVVATLTVATRCYASPHQNPINISATKDSSSRSSTSKVVLASINVDSSPTSDISLISRGKREYLSTVVNSLNQDLPGPSRNRTKYKVQDSSPETDSFTGNSTSEVSSELIGSSDDGNDTRVRDSLNGHVHLKQRSQEREDHGRDIRVRRPMPPVHVPGNALNDSSVLVLVVSVVVLTIALGLVTCVLNHYRATAANPREVGQTPTTTPMLSVVSAGAAAGVGGMDRLRSRGTRELAAARDRQVRMHSVRTDLAINLPPRISMPDGEEHPYHSRLHIRDPEQESEIYQKCIKPPPNRTVLESESPPPYRSSSVGLLGSISGSSSSSGDWSSSSSSSTGAGSGCGVGGGGGLNNAPLVVRCNSMSSSSTGSSSKRGGGGGVETSSSSTSSANHQKTDFLQRTVKRFTGGKKTNTTSSSVGGFAVAHQQHVNVPVVIVPMRRNDHNFTSSSNSPSSSLTTTTTTTAITTTTTSSSSSSSTTTPTINFSSNRPKPSV